MDNVVTSIMVLPGDGTVSEFVGGYSDWANKGGSLTALDEPAKAGEESRRPAAEKPEPAGSPAQPKKLSYKDQRELDALPARIEQLETRKAELEQKAAEPSFYQQEQQAVKALLDELAEIAGELESAYARWDELES
jgi:ATP-binding cassette subfamily F protein uup